MKYQLLQGIMTPAGNGDSHLVRESENLEELKKEFEHIKNDYRGWSTANKNDLIETIIRRDTDNPDDIIEFNSISINDAKKLANN